MTAEQVEAAIAEVRAWLDDYPENTVIALYQARAWVVKGYPSWEAMCAAEFPRKFLLPRPERQQVVASLRAAGMSSRGIASAVGASVGTVHADIAASRSELNSSQSDTITGLDGRSRPAQAAPPARRPVPAIRRRRPLPDAWRDAATDLEKVATRLERLARDDRFPSHRENLRASDVQRAQQAVQRVLDALAGDAQ